MRKINLYSFCDSNKHGIRPILKGIYHNNGFMTATDGYILFSLKGEYTSENEGKVVIKNGEVIDGLKYPDIDSLFEKYIINEHDVAIPYEKFDEVFKGYEDNLRKDKNFDAMWCSIKGKAYFSMKALTKFVKACNARDMKIYLTVNNLANDYICLIGKNDNGDRSLLMNVRIPNKNLPYTYIFNID